MASLGQGADSRRGLQWSPWPQAVWGKPQMGLITETVRPVTALQAFPPSAACLHNSQSCSHEGSALEVCKLLRAVCGLSQATQRSVKYSCLGKEHGMEYLGRGLAIPNGLQRLGSNRELSSRTGKCWHYREIQAKGGVQIMK